MTEIELTETQRQALQAEPGYPVDVLEPATPRRYVLLAREQDEQYERMRALLEQHPVGSPEPRVQIAPQLLQSMQSYCRELPERLKGISKKQQWVAYHGVERVCFGQTDLEVYQECFRRGLPRGEFYVGKVEADPEGIPP
jgi:hypothetical protein